MLLLSFSRDILVYKNVRLYVVHSPDGLFNRLFIESWSPNVSVVFVSGIFMYGNHFQNTADKIECMLLAKIMSINSPHFHFHACNFTERIMYLRYVSLILTWYSQIAVMMVLL